MNNYKSYTRQSGYELNDWGYRDLRTEFAKEKAIWAFGCSQTFGIGLKIEETWPYLLEKLVNQKVFNFGVPGAGIETHIRILKALVNKPGVVLPKDLCLWGHYDIRYEFQIKDRLETFILADYLRNEHLQRKRPELMQLAWDDSVNQQRYNNNLNLLTSICKDSNINLHMITIKHDEVENMLPKEDRDYARDGTHYGHNFHKAIAKEFSLKIS